MNSFKIIQIGDIHYSQATATKFHDTKDSAFPSELANQTSIGPYRQALRAVTKERDAGKGADCILFCGDITTYGDIDEYKKAVNSLIKALSLNRNEYWKNGVVVVAGNHDIDRANIDHSSRNYKSKFKALELAWEESGCPFFKHDELNGTNIKLKKQSQICLFPLNSCIGCGEKRCYPPAIQKAFHKVLDDYSKLTDTKDAFKLLGEDLDTPAFLESDINFICNEINELSHKSVPVLVSHHNLLPQTIPRFDMYTELLNSGFVRSRLGKCKHPILYCHAHIHSDPIEKIIDIKNGSHPVITISAPQIIEGFNVLNLNFNKDGIPLGCTIERHRILSDGHVDKKYTKVPFVNPNDSTYLMSEKTTKIFSAVPNGVTIRFMELAKNIRQNIGKVSEAVLMNSLLEAEWFGLLKIKNAKERNKYWQIEKVVP